MTDEEGAEGQRHKAGGRGTLDDWYLLEDISDNVRRKTAQAS